MHQYGKRVFKVYKNPANKIFKVKLKAVKKVFKDYKDVKEKELIVITNPSGMKISLNDKNYGNSPVRIKGLKYREV
ncbi:MAG TPA: PEGA domain-containing protein [candidate division CPR3 bacterium]|uniref:PEGA domain-containing protein n=1 Tax=candidate division CPR3 bacterium TaxID=2268181 RepID=A0A7C1NPY5_UNCC3|nr:PEGA domain-containing protein [candidate division CPR3 bacterium]